MKYLFVGGHQDSLASGRPLVFGDEIDEKDVTEADKRLPLVSTPEPTPAPTPAPAPTTPEAI